MGTEFCLHGESAKLTKSQLSQGQGIWKVKLRGNLFSGNKGTTLSSYCPLARLPQKSWAAGPSPASQASKQWGEIFISPFWLTPNPRIKLSSSFLSALRQSNTNVDSLPTSQMYSATIQGHQLHIGPKGTWKLYYITLVASHSYYEQQPSQPFSMLLRPLVLLPPPSPHLLSTKVFWVLLLCFQVLKPPTFSLFLLTVIIQAFPFLLTKTNSMACVLDPFRYHLFTN